jgi:hypothetical protein
LILLALSGISSVVTLLEAIVYQIDIDPTSDTGTTTMVR